MNSGSECNCFLSRVCSNESRMSLSTAVCIKHLQVVLCYQKWLGTWQHVPLPPLAAAASAKSRLASRCIVIAALSWAGTKWSIASLLHLRHGRGGSDTKHWGHPLCCVPQCMFVCGRPKCMCSIAVLFAWVSVGFVCSFICMKKSRRVSSCGIIRACSIYNVPILILCRCECVCHWAFL